MPFGAVDFESKHNMKPRATVTYKVFRYGEKEFGPQDETKLPRLTVSIPTVLCGVAKSEKWAFLVGDGDDAGKIVVVGDLSPLAKQAGAQCVVPISQHKYFFKWNFGHVPRIAEFRVDAFVSEVRKIDDETYEMTVPIGMFWVVNEEPAADSEEEETE